MTTISGIVLIGDSRAFEESLQPNVEETYVAAWSPPAEIESQLAISHNTVSTASLDVLTTVISGQPSASR
jgi:hypothetical protein